MATKEKSTGTTISVPSMYYSILNCIIDFIVRLISCWSSSWCICCSCNLPNGCNQNKDTSTGICNITYIPNTLKRTSANENSLNYKNVFDAVLRIYKEEGIKAFGKGMVARYRLWHIHQFTFLA